MTRLLLTTAGYLFSVGVPILAILERFPFFSRAGGEVILSGLGVLLLVIALIPLRRGVLSRLEAWLKSPSAYSVWLVLFLLCRLLSSITDAVGDVALISTLSSLLGALFFRLSRRAGAAGRGTGKEGEEGRGEA